MTKCSKVLRASAEKISSQLSKGTLPSRYWQFVLLGSSKTSHLWYTRPRIELEYLGNLFGCFSYFSFSHFDVVSQIDTTSHWTSEKNSGEPGKLHPNYAMTTAAPVDSTSNTASDTNANMTGRGSIVATQSSTKCSF